MSFLLLLPNENQTFSFLYRPTHLLYRGDFTSSITVYTLTVYILFISCVHINIVLILKTWIMYNFSLLKYVLSPYTRWTPFFILHVTCYYFILYFFLYSCFTVYAYTKCRWLDISHHMACVFHCNIDNKQILNVDIRHLSMCYTVEVITLAYCSNVCKHDYKIS